MKRYGGHAIAVYNPDETNRASFRKCYQLSAHADRLKHIAPADYRAGTAWLPVLVADGPAAAA